ncbi:MAG: right-handed parallel beta-helix repeat-containing protein, partial [Pseudomonadota bacterium]
MLIPQALGARLTLLFLLFFFISNAQAISAVAGDVAPQGLRDNLLTASDITLVQKFVSGEIVPSITETKLSDVYPLGAADGLVNANDIHLLNEALLGQVTLPPVTLVAAPTLTNPGFSSTILNPIPISGTALPNSIVQIYVNGIFQDSATSAADGTFTISTALVDGANSIFAITINAGTPSPNSNSFTVNYTNTVSRVQSGSISGNVVWTPGSPAQVYTVTGSDLVVPVGAKLVLQPGTELQFASGRKLTVNGTLSIRGNKTTKVKLASTNVTPVGGTWNGITVNNTATNISIENAIIESATQAILIDGVAAQIKNNTIRYFNSSGIYVRNVGANASVIQGNIVDNLNDAANCLTVDTSSPAIIGNTLTNCQNGLYISGNASPVVNGNNIITSNGYGVRFSGAALTTLPVITGNQIFSNANYNYYANSFAVGAQNLKLNAINNWWGTTDASLISASIYDLTDSQTSTTMPTVDYSSYLNAAGGTPVAGNYLIGQLPAATTTLTAGATYNVLGYTFVQAGNTLTIPAGTTLRFHGYSYLVADGTVKIQGTSSNKVNLTSGRPVPARGDWGGVWIRGGTGSVVEYANIDYGQYGVYVENVPAQIKSNTIRNFNTSGIYIKTVGANTSVIQGNIIDNLNDTANCLTTDVSSPTITGNTLTNCQNGLYISG